MVEVRDVSLVNEQFSHWLSERRYFTYLWNTILNVNIFDMQKVEGD